MASIAENEALSLQIKKAPLSFKQTLHQISQIAEFF